MNSENTSSLDIIAAQSTAVEPVKFQSTLITNMTKAMLREMAPPCLLRAPTGSGKTFVIGRVLENVSAKSPTLWFWFVPFINLVQQTEDSIAGNTNGLTPVSLLRGRNQTPKNGLVVISTAQSVAKARSRTQGYTDGQDDTTRSLDGQVALARSMGLKIGLIVDEAHIGLDDETEFGKFASWLKPDRLLMATATPKDDKLNSFIASGGFSDFESFTVSRDDVVQARLNKKYIEAVVYDLRESMQTVTDLQQTVILQAWKRNQRLKRRLEEHGIPIVPLLLVQVANGESAVAEARGHLMHLCKVAPSAIGEHSSSDPDPVLMASIANDTTKEVLIFKQSAGTGFDAPRAFVLASTKPVNDSDFAAQFIGRVMRVHRDIRKIYPKPNNIDAEFNTAYVYLGNAQAQAGFEQAVVNTANLKTQLEGQSEKLVARRMMSGAMVYTNRQTHEAPLFYESQLPSADDAGVRSRTTSASPGQLPTTKFGSTDSMFDDDIDQIDPNFIAPAAPQPRARKTPNSREELLDALSDMGVRTYQLRKDLLNVPQRFKREDRPEMENMAQAAKAAATKLGISSGILKNALDIALGRAKDRELHTELTEKTKSQQNVVVVMNREKLSKEAHAALAKLPQVEEEDANLIIDVLTKRVRPSVESALQDVDEELPCDADIKRKARDAAYAVIRKEHESLGELLHEEISAQAVTVDSGPLPSYMMFANEIALQPSSKNIYGVHAPSLKEFGQLSSVLTVDARDAMAERIFSFSDGNVMLAPYDGSHVEGDGEGQFTSALDRADFVKWWHRNPPKKSYSVRLVRGEHKNYFYPDFVVFLEHFPGDEPLQRLIETKESIKDAVRKAKRASDIYGPVMFLTKDQNKWRWINLNGTLGSVVDMDDLLNMQEWLRQTVPTSSQ
jgi:type III restriction enzyme